MIEDNFNWWFKNVFYYFGSYSEVDLEVAYRAGWERALEVDETLEELVKLSQEGEE